MLVGTDDRCPFCGSLLDRDGICVNCLAEQSRCLLCFQSFHENEEVVRCLECNSLFHREHFYEWFDVHGECPVCRVKLGEDDFRSYVLGSDTIRVLYRERRKKALFRREVFERFRFRLPFYDFQRVIVDDILGAFSKKDSYLLVSPPGSGKTIIGLAVSRDLMVNTLVLVPNLAVLGSWLERAEMFFDARDASVSVREVIGSDRGDLRPITLMTYQKMVSVLRRHELLSGSKSVDKVKEGLKTGESGEGGGKKGGGGGRALIGNISLIDRLVAHRIGLIIVDEAHRLNGEWGLAVLKLKKIFPRVKILGLTACKLSSNGEGDHHFYRIFPEVSNFVSLPVLVRAGVIVPYRDIPLVIKREAVEELVNDFLASGVEESSVDYYRNLLTACLRE